MSALFQTYQRWTIEPESAQGCWLNSTEGKKYLDFTSGIGVLNLGHRHPAIQQAVQKQLDRYWHTSNLFQSSLQEETAALLTELSGLDKVFFCNSGAEANEAAIKLARKATGRSKIVTCQQSFHGRTFATMAATGQEKVRIGYGIMLESFEYIEFNDPEAVKKAVDENTAAIMLEIIQGEGGIHIASKEFLHAIQTICKQTGALLIIDEIQTGIGRTGKAFSFQHYDVEPDIITAAKGLGNGLPVGAMLGKQNLNQFFGPGSHGSTFGGNPVSMSAAKATLNELKKPGFFEKVEENSQYLVQQLEGKLQEFPFISEIRSKGLMIGIQLTIEVAPFLVSLQEEGMLALSAGQNVLRLLPPLTVEKHESDAAVNMIALAAMKQVAISH
ncbi:acetylornithine transaminase [Peribacillus saganii]|uniref:Acetylornithine aminotransferase n=1 Tax=Peribacillus saganii TaxID=2303992 RepID=A0A372LN52_9BACI|nr:acetylornithine transaminase [Peribacillus saganii]RFU68044.1 acetylornithine transaminase [Peribacillus saganii]